MNEASAAPGVTEAELESVTCHEDLVRLLAREFARADLSLRAVESRADKAGGTRLPRATCADMLAGRRFPKKAVMLAFLRVCQVPEERLPAWERTWERLRVTQLPIPAAPPGRHSARPTARADGLGSREATPPAVWAAGPGSHASTAPAVRAAGPGGRGSVLPADGTAGPGSSESAPPAAGTAAPGSRESAPPADGTAGPGSTLPPDRTEPAGTRPRRRRRLTVLAASGVLALVALGIAGQRVMLSQHGAAEQPGSPVKVTDDGRAYDPGGSSRFTVTVDPANTGVRLIRRLDAGVADQYVTITVNERLAAIWRPLPGDSVHKWRNQMVLIPRALTEGQRSLTIVNTCVSSSEGCNEFLYTVEQRINGTWSKADEVDVGPDHKESEAAHDYRITGQGWVGTQTFLYPPGGEHDRVE
jgi:hypothetical protein